MKFKESIHSILVVTFIIYIGLLLPSLFAIIHPYNDSTIIEIISFIASLSAAISLIIIGIKRLELKRSAFLVPLLCYSAGEIAYSLYRIIQYESYTEIYYIIVTICFITIYIMASNKKSFMAFLVIAAIALIPKLLGILSGSRASLLAAALLLSFILGAYLDYKRLNKEAKPKEEALIADDEEKTE